MHWSYLPPPCSEEKAYTHNSRPKRHVHSNTLHLNKISDVSWCFQLPSHHTHTHRKPLSLHTPMLLFFRPESANATLSAHIRGTGAAVAPLSCANARESQPIKQQLITHIHSDQRLCRRSQLSAGYWQYDDTQWVTAWELALSLLPVITLTTLTDFFLIITPQYWFQLADCDLEYDIWHIYNYASMIFTVGWEPSILKSIYDDIYRIFKAIFTLFF